MSIQSIINSIAQVNREINTVENSISQIDANINRKQKEANTILTKISREKDLKRIITYQNEHTRKIEEINKLEKDKKAKLKILTEKQKKKYDLQTNLSKEEQKERDKVKREQQEILSIQQQITREMQKQKEQSLNSINSWRQSPVLNESYDVFISHASEDKDAFVRPFATLLKDYGLKVWYDEFSLKIGDSLRRSIDNGLKNSRYGIVVLSEAFFSKEWPQRELDGLFAREVNGEKVILPIWHKISKNEVLKYSPIIADMLALNTSSFTIEEIAKQISDRVLS